MSRWTWSPVGVERVEYGTEAASIPAGQGAGDDLQYASHLMHIRTALPDSAALVARIPQAVIGVADEVSPMAQCGRGPTGRQSRALETGQHDASVW